ncbi:MAG: tetratricopeptide repeat protein [Calditrichaeota bacterium]|nr:MAG: tetratricopeptide repeat protein [Calditrichota bacterium]
MKKSKKLLCPHCGQTIKPAFHFCPQCGLHLVENQPVLNLLNALDQQRRGQAWKALEELKELARLFPKNAHVHKLLGNQYFHLGQLDWAIFSYLRAIDLDHEYIDAYYDLGVAYYYRGSIKKATEAYQKVLQLNPAYHAAHYRIALCYYHSGQLNVAAQHFQQTIASTPEYVMAHYHLGVIYYKLGNYEKAVDEFKQVLKENPDDVASAKYLKMITEASDQKLVLE